MMNKFFKIIDAFEKRVILIVFNLFKLINPKSIDDLDYKITNVTKYYEYLIEQYELIQKKKSNLSRRKRQEVELRIAHLISKGHIKINS